MLCDEISDIKLLTKCWQSIFSGKKEDIRENSRGIDHVTLNEFKENLATNLANISYQLSNSLYKMSDLKGIPILKANGKYRLVTSPTIADRIVHKAILSVVNDIFYPIVNTGVSYCGVKKNIFSYKKRNSKNHISALKKMASLVKQENFWVYESDIEGFFDNVPKKTMFEMIIKELPDTSINTLINAIIFFDIGNNKDLKKEKFKGKLKLPRKNHGISQGSPLSPLFSNIFLSDLDKSMKNECGDAFIRYVDDFIIISNSEKSVKDLGHKASIKLEGLGLNLAEDKTKTIYLKDGGQSIDFLGLKISNQKISAKNPRALKAKFNNDFLSIKSKEMRKLKTLELQIKQMNFKIQGCANYYLPFHSKNLFDELNALISSRKQNDKFKNLEIIKYEVEKNKHDFPSVEEWVSYFK